MPSAFEDWLARLGLAPGVEVAGWNVEDARSRPSLVALALARGAERAEVIVRAAGSGFPSFGHTKSFELSHGPVPDAVVREVGPERRGREPAAREDLPLLVEDLRARRKPPPVEPSVRGEERHQAFVAAAPPDLEGGEELLELGRGAHDVDVAQEHESVEEHVAHRAERGAVQIDEGEVGGRIGERRARVPPVELEHERRNEVVLRREVVGEVPRAHPGRPRDVADPDAVQSALVEEEPRGVEDALSRIGHHGQDRSLT